MLAQFAYLATPLLMATSLVLLLGRNWRWMIGALALQFFGVFWLVSISWPVGLALVKLVAGLMAGAVLAASSSPSRWLAEDYSRPAQVFRVFATILFWMVIFAGVPLLATWLPVPNAVLTGGTLLMGMGLLQLGITTRPLLVVVGLITLLSGFEVIYAGLESSILVAGLQAVILLGLSLVGAYMMLAPSMEEEG